jgi:hypothetical protein
MLIYSLFIWVLFSDSTFLVRKYKFGSLYSGFKGQPFTGAVSHALIAHVKVKEECMEICVKEANHVHGFFASDDV